MYQLSAYITADMCSSVLNNLWVVLGANHANGTTSSCTKILQREYVILYLQPNNSWDWQWTKSTCWFSQCMAMKTSVFVIKPLIVDSERAEVHWPVAQDKYHCRHISFPLLPLSLHFTRRKTILVRTWTSSRGSCQRSVHCGIDECHSDKS